MNAKLALVSAVFSAFIIVIFFILITDGALGVRYDQINEHIRGYGYLLEHVNSLVNNNTGSEFTDGFAVGAAFSLAFTLLCIYLANGRKTILLLCGYFLFRAIILSVLLNVNITVILPDFYQFQTVDIPLLVGVSQLFLLWFISNLFRLNKNGSKSFYTIKTICWVLLIYLPASFLLSIQLSFYISVIFELLINTLLLVLSIHLIRQQQRLAILFSIFALTQFIFSGLNIIALVGFNLDVYGDSPYLYSSSFWISAFITVFTLSRGYYYQIQDTQIAELKALKSLKKSEKTQSELLILQEDSQEQLESRVQERTLELNIALQELEEANRELAEKNTLDELTGLYNRRYYDQKVIAEHRRSRRNLTPLSLVVIDIDHFKKVNDTHGHLAGDQCLIWVSAKIKASLGRVTDLGCRYGGEEFCLILPETDTKGAVALAETLRTSIEAETVLFQEIEIPLTISCGVSTYWQQPDITPEDIFSAADQALYFAKKNGRNQVQKKTLSDKVKPQ